MFDAIIKSNYSCFYKRNQMDHQQQLLKLFIDKNKEQLSEKVRSTQVDHVAARILTVQDVEQAASDIKNGRLVAFPTQTVYGLGANALNPEALKKIY